MNAFVCQFKHRFLFLSETKMRMKIKIKNYTATENKTEKVTLKFVYFDIDFGANLNATQNVHVLRLTINLDYTILWSCILSIYLS